MLSGPSMPLCKTAIAALPLTTRIVVAFLTVAELSSSFPATCNLRKRIRNGNHGGVRDVENLLCRALIAELSVGVNGETTSRAKGRLCMIG